MVLKQTEKKSNETKSINEQIKRVVIKLLIISLLIVGGASCIFNYLTLNIAMADSLLTTAQVAAGQVKEYVTTTTNSVEVIGSIEKLTEESVSAEEKQEILDEYAEHFGWLYMDITDVSGVGIGTASLNVAGEDYFELAIKGETVITELIYSEREQGLVMLVVAPLWQSGEFNTEIAGTVIVALDARELSEMLGSIQISANGAAYIIDDKGTEIGAEQYNLVEEGWNTIASSETDASLKPLAKLEKKMINGESGFGTYLFQGAFKYMGYVPVGINGWSLGVTAPITDFTDGTVLSIIITIIMLIVMSFVGKKIATKLGDRIGSAVCICADRLRLLAEGDLSTEVQSLDTQDETKILENSTRAIVESQQTIIGDVSYLLREMAGGNFSIDSKIGETAYVGEYLELLSSIYVLKNDMADTLRSVVEASKQVDAGAEQLAEAAQDLAEGATNQAGAVEELFATVIDVATQVEKNNDVTILTNERVKAIGNEAVQCEMMMHELTGKMENIKNSSAEISNIIAEIEEIASQTNLLSLNASIEAARAGEAGRGFAVVADQIGKLAEQSAQSAVNTRGLIEASIQEINKGNEATNMTVEHIAQVMKGLEEVVELIAAIQQASSTQTIAIGEIKQGVEVISNVVQNNSATAEETSATSEELSAQAQCMDTLVEKFIL